MHRYKTVYNKPRIYSYLLSDKDHDQEQKKPPKKTNVISPLPLSYLCAVLHASIPVLNLETCKSPCNQDLDFGPYS